MLRSPHQVRLAIVGRTYELREVAFDSLNPTPSLAGVALKAHGPAAKERLKALSIEASGLAIAMGYPADAFAIVGLGNIGLVALLPRDPLRNEEDRMRLMEALGYSSPSEPSEANKGDPNQIPLF